MRESEKEWELRMKKKTVGFLRKNYAFLITFFVIAGYHMYMTVNHDSIFFSRQLEEMSYMEFMRLRYHEWSSRLLIETGLLFFTNHLYLWRVLDTLVWMFMLYGMVKFLDWDYTPQLAGVVCLLFFCYDIRPMGSAGWIATINNYIWPFACFCGLLLILKKLFRDGRLQGKTGGMGICFTILAGNQEQVAAAVFGVLFLVMAYLVRKRRKISPWIWSWFAAILTELVFILTCPGNVNRKIAETEQWFPEFAELGLWQKLNLGITSVCHTCMFEKNYLFLIFLVLLCMAVQQKQAEKWKKYIAFFPVAVTVITGYLLDAAGLLFPAAVNLRDALKNTEAFEAGKEQPAVILLFYGAVMLCVLWELSVLLHDHEKDGLILLAISGIGFGTGMMMGFSPTIWVSGARTLFFWQMALVLASGCLWNRFLQGEKRWKTGMMILAFAVISLVTELS